MDDNQPTNVPPAPKPMNDEQEWTAAEANLTLDHRSSLTEDEPDVRKVPANPAPTEDTPTDGGTPETGATDADTPDAAKSGADEPSSVDGTVREQREIQRAIAEDQKAVIDDVREQMFSDVPDQLVDADGDPIKTIQDVQKLVDPNTGEAFTEEAAAIWLLQAQQNFNREREERQAQIQEIAETNLTLKDQADAIKAKYGEVLKANPDVAKRLMAQFENTLVKDEKSGIITKAPVDMEDFFDTALSPYAKLAEQEQTAAQAQAQAKKEVARVRAVSDRQDIYGGGNTKVVDPEDAEWEEAAKSIYNR